MTTTATPVLPMILEEVEVVGVERPSPSFVRVELGSPALADFGVEGRPLHDQRIKLVFPEPGCPVPSFAGADESWYPTWLERPVAERGHMRTYTVREVRGRGVDTRVVVDLVTHGTDGHGQAGPGSTWAASARVGDRIVLMGPRRGSFYGGIEFDPGDAGRLLLVGDETAVPAVLATLSALPDDARGAAYLEVPHADDVQEVTGPRGVEVTWLAREGGPHGERLHAAVLAHLDAVHALSVARELEDADIDPDLWETPAYSSSGEQVGPAGPAGDPARPGLDDLYAWIAGESRMVTGLRRVLVKELGVDRRQVAFMGYWRDGVAMRS